MKEQNSTNRKASKMRESCIRMVLSILLFSTIFMLILPSVKEFLLFFDLIWLAILLCYGTGKNAKLIGCCLAVSAGCIAAFLAIKLITGCSVRLLTYIEMPLIVVMLCELLVAFVVWRGHSKQPKANTDKLTLYSERQDDLVRIKKYITEFCVLGVNAPWGKGKSFVLNHLKADSDIQKQFEVIHVDLLSCDLDAVELILVEELEKLFQRNRIYSQNSRHLKSLLGKNDWSSIAWSLVDKTSEGLSASFESILQELDKLDKKVLIIFEDIDRIFEKETIQKIFAISEKLSCEKLHIIFQYDMSTLEKNGFNRDYLEKYMPYSVNLTEISYEKLVKYQWKEVGLKETPIEMKAVQSIGTNIPGIYEINHILGTNMEIHIDLTGQASPRKVHLFLSELKMLLTDNEEFAKAENVAAVLNFVFIKHFLTPYYDSLQIGDSPLQTLKFHDEQEERTISEVLADFTNPTDQNSDSHEIHLQAFRQLLTNADNRNVLMILLLLGYELQIETMVEGLDEAIAEPSQSIKKKEKNEKIDRLVWKLLANGTSELTDKENAIRKLKAEVLSKTGKEQVDAWRKYENDMFHERLPNGNRTIFLFGIDPFLQLFRAMQLANSNEQEWTSFLDFYFFLYQKEKVGEKTFSVAIIDSCNYCNLRSKKNFFQIIRFMNQLKVTYNANDAKSYQMFFENYMGAIINLGYSERFESWMFKLPGKVSKSKDMVKELLTDLKRELIARQKEWELDYVVREYSDVIQFVEKNLELIDCKESMPERGPSFGISEFRSHWTHQDAVDRLIKLKNESKREQFEAELERSYLSGKLYLRELEAILKA